jgi:hypothetical protein
VPSCGASSVVRTRSAEEEITVAAGIRYGEFRRGWGLGLSAMLGIALGLSRMPFYTIGVFAPHLSAEFGWSMGQIMGGLTITTLMVPEYNLMAFFIALISYVLAPWISLARRSYINEPPIS